MSILFSAAAFVVALGVLVTVHEFGHFWVARRLGVKILRFSVGFGRPLWMRRFGSDRTEFTIAMVPLGGYVKMLDEREGEVPAEERHRAFNRRPLGARTAIVAAGPALNFLFAVAAYWLMFVVGVTGLRPVVGEVEPGSAAARAGLTAGAEIVAIGGKRTPTWEAVLHASMTRVLDAGQMRLRVRPADDAAEREMVLDLSAVDIDDLSRGNFFSRLGFEPRRPRYPAVIGEVMGASPAEAAGLRAGDRVVAAGGEPIEHWNAWVDYVRARPGERFDVEVERDGERVSLSIRPGRVEDAGEAIGRIGAALDADAARERAAALTAVERYAPHSALVQAAGKTWDVSLLTLEILGKMLLGEASVRNLSGPISIARYAGESASVGLTAFLSFLAVVSVSLGVLNLLPIPLLDGGHLLYYLIEFVTRRPLSEGVQALGQQIGLVLLLGLMGLALYNDVLRWLAS